MASCALCWPRNTKRGGGCTPRFGPVSVPPLAAEDLFELTERLGAVSERAYGVAREAELSRTAPDPRLGQQVEAIAAAMTPLGAAIRALPDSHAAPLADQALEQLTLAEHAYREAIADLESETDLRRELRRREQYRRCELLAEAVQHLARRTWHAVYKSQKDIKSGPPVLACLPDAASMAQGHPRSGTSAPGQIAHLLGDSGHRLGDRVCASAAVSVASAAGLEHRSGALP